MRGLVAVLDIGKTTARLSVVDPASGQPVHTARRRNAALPGPVRQLDVGGLQAWLLDSLAGCPERARIGCIVPVAHGAACVMLDGAGGIVLAPDYEDSGFEQDDHDYRARRDRFEVTGSPALPLGLNLGRQIFHVQHRLPGHFERIASILTYPQYWAWWLCGVAASELTSLGCHSDLWSPAAAAFSPLVHRQGWDRLFPAPRRASEALGPVLAKHATRCGLDPGCRVLCGIHDSNASYLQHRTHRPAARPFSVISSGTWTVILSNAAALPELRQDRDMLANIDAFGCVVGTARFMGGREYEAVAGTGPATPDQAALARVLAGPAMVRPAFTAGGQFPGHQGAILGAAALDRQARAALASLYVALLSDVALSLLEAEADIVIDGPLAENPVYPPILAALRPTSRVQLVEAGAGTTGGALCLALGKAAPAPVLRQVRQTTAAREVAEHARRWRALLP